MPMSGSLRSFCAVVMLVLWVPATVHCELEDLSAIFSAFGCESHAVEPEQGEECNHDACDLVEEGGYRLDSCVLEVAAPSSTGVFDESIFRLVPSPAEASLGWVSRRSGRAENWSDFCRYAERVTPPVRAPASIS